MNVQFFDWHREAKSYSVNLGDDIILYYDTGNVRCFSFNRMRLYVEAHFVLCQKPITDPRYKA